MRTLVLKAAILALAAMLGAVAPGNAQTEEIPFHEPGAICFTQLFWCWADPPGLPGYGCYCQTVDGPVQGVLG